MSFAPFFADKSVEIKADVGGRLFSSAYIDKLAETLMRVLHCRSAMVVGGRFLWASQPVLSSHLSCERGRLAGGNWADRTSVLMTDVFDVTGTVAAVFAT